MEYRACLGVSGFAWGELATPRQPDALLLKNEQKSIF
jgi:hypothetical protein